MGQSQSHDGIVSLVGAGPGDPELISVRGMRLLERADVVVYDYLANPQLLVHCPRAEQIYVGKQAARHSMTQEQINELLVAQGRLGRRVVRLKGGDPFVFGRGGEECEALAAAGIRFEVVPGITAAIAAPAYAGIPVTHRDLNSSFTLITGHEKEAEYQEAEARSRDAGDAASDVYWDALAKLPCLAFYMGVKALPRISAKLIEHGMSKEMPAAAIQWGTTPRQRTVVGTIGDLPERVAEAKLTPPALIIVGKVVEMRRTINWFENRPLFGKTIVVTRTRQQASDLTLRLTELGAHVIEAATIEVGPAKDQSAVDAGILSAGEYDWVVFTSQNGVEFTKKRLMELGRDARVFGKAKVAVIGEATANAVREMLCLNVDLCPERFVAEALAEEFAKRSEIKGKRFLMLRAEIARPLLRERLAAEGAAQVNDVAIYETMAAKHLPPVLLEQLEAGKVDWVTFTSSSTARNFVALLGEGYKEKLAGVKIASIGPITSGAVREMGLAVTVEAGVFNVEGVVEGILGSLP